MEDLLYSCLHFQQPTQPSLEEDFLVTIKFRRAWWNVILVILSSDVIKHCNYVTLAVLALNRFRLRGNILNLLKCTMPP